MKGVAKGNADPAYRKKLIDESNHMDGSKAERVLGVTYRSKDETLGDMAKSLRARFNF